MGYVRLLMWEDKAKAADLTALTLLPCLVMNRIQ